MRSIASAAAIVWGCVALTTGGCAFSDGDPWARASLALVARFEPEAARLDSEGRLITADDYAVSIARLALVADDAGLRMGSGGASGDFDPAQPPDGYSLCHGGHCHASDGRLVPYDVVAAELAGAGADGYALVLPADGREVELGRDPAPVPLQACDATCDLPRGEVVRATALVDRLILSGRVFDRRGGAAARLPAEGLAVELELQVETQLSAPASADVDDHHPVGLHAALDLALPASLFDGADFQALSAGGASVDQLAALAETAAANLARDGALMARITRR
ncbi:MAG: hypothetical protein R3F39_10375 [Myxococcota bacterium]